MGKLRRPRVCQDCQIEIAAGPRLKCRFCGMRVCALCYARKHAPVMPGDDVCRRQAATGIRQLQLELVADR